MARQVSITTASFKAQVNVGMANALGSRPAIALMQNARYYSEQSAVSPDAGSNQPGTSTSGNWAARITHIPASIAESVNTGISSASSFLSNQVNLPGQLETEHGAEGPEQERSWRRRIAGLSAHLTHPFHGSGSAAGQGISVSAEVQKALREGVPVVALESTIISHGMPFPQNLETAQAVEQVVRDGGAIPATIAIVEGAPLVGLTPQQLERIARSGKAVQKTARRDLPYVLAKKHDGATTVSATMLLAARAGISVFVTGGIGGVHRGGQDSLDISSDLTEFSKSPVAVICAGAKSILDIPRTLEFLETQGVTVAAYGADDFPAFFARSSACKAPCRIDNPEEAASLIREAHNLGSGILIGVPIPDEASKEGSRIESATAQALDEAREKQLSGAETTPFLLARIQELTGGLSLQANIKLVKNNAAVGAAIAKAMSKQRHD